MHHGSLASEDTVTSKIYQILASPERIGRWQDPLTILSVLRQEYQINVTAISTYISSIRIQLRDLYKERGETMIGPRDGPQPKDMGPGFFYRIVRIPRESSGQLPLI